MMDDILAIVSHTLSQYSFFFFNDTATTEIYTLSLHDALPISPSRHARASGWCCARAGPSPAAPGARAARAKVPHERNTNQIDRKSTRLNSSHQIISYAVFCLKKKNKTKPPNEGSIGTSNYAHH